MWLIARPVILKNFWLSMRRTFCFIRQPRTPLTIWVSKKLPTVKSLQTEYAKVLEEKKKAYAEYRRSREEMRELLTAKANVDRLLNMEAEHDTEKEKDHAQR